ncbi:MAG: hypothetical protein ACYTFW_18255 [Planctomycetota bacterium]|jgi:hypothetical protein
MNFSKSLYGVFSGSTAVRSSVDKHILSEKGYELNGQSGDPILLGTKLDEVISGMKDNYDWLVGLYESFVKRLVRNRAEAEQRLDHYIQNDVSTDGPLLARLGEEPFVRVRETVDALMPYLRRMSLNHNNDTRSSGE